MDIGQIIINYCQLSMNNQSLKIGDSILNVQPLRQELKSSDFIEKVLTTHHRPQKEKSVTFSKFFDLKEQVQFSVAIAKFAIIFNIDVELMDCLRKLSDKQRNNIKNFNFQSILADTNRKQFTKYFKKSTDPQMSLSAAHNKSIGLVLIIQGQEDGKSKIKFLNYQNLMHTIMSNIQIGDNYEQLSKFIELKYKRIQSVVCYQKVKSLDINLGFYEFLLDKFQQVTYVGFLENQQFHINDYQTQIIYVNERSLTLYKHENWLVLGSQTISSKALEQIFRYYNNYSVTDRMILRQIEKSKTTKDLIKDNEYCINFYGLFYNFIILKGLYRNNDQNEASRLFLEDFIKQKEYSFGKNQKKQKKPFSRNKGHYPARIDKGSKVCCVCEKDKKKKSRFKCEKCTETYSKQIAICIDHFKQFHSNIPKYLPKGVKEGTHQNEIKQFKSTKMDSQQKLSKKQIQIRKDVNQIVNKWGNYVSLGEESLKQLSHLQIRKQLSKNNNMVPPFLYFNQFFYPEMDPNLGFYPGHIKQQIHTQPIIPQKREQAEQ